MLLLQNVSHEPFSETPNLCLWLLTRQLIKQAKDAMCYHLMNICRAWCKLTGSNPCSLLKELKTMTFMDGVNLTVETLG